MKMMLRGALQVAVVAAISCTTAFAQVVEYYHSDSVGSVQVVTNAAGAVVARHDYMPFGDEWVVRPDAQPLRFAGKERDLETGLDYFGARYYGSRLGRFTGVDPVYDVGPSLADPQRWNRYSYSLNNPYRYTDPDGRLVQEVTVVVVTATKAAGAGFVVVAGSGAGIGIALAGGGFLVANEWQASAKNSETRTLAAIENDRIIRAEQAELAATPSASGAGGGKRGSIGTRPPGALGWKLRAQLASEAQMAELRAGGITMAGVGHQRGIDDIDRLIASYGGQVSDWAKIKSSHYKDGVMSFETHAYRNVSTGEIVEPKTKFGDDSALHEFQQP
jgi:RHS repeat-associated protein